MAARLSARNQIEGKIVELEVGGVMAHVAVQVGKNVIESVITRRSAELTWSSTGTLPVRFLPPFHPAQKQLLAAALGKRGIVLLNRS